MKKVLYLIDTLQVGGAENSLLEIALRLEKWEPVVVSIYQGTLLRPKFETAGIKVYSLDIKNKFGWIDGVRGINDIILKEKPDLIHATLFRAEQFSRLLGPYHKIPVLNSFVNDSYSEERFNSLILRQRLALHLYRFIDRVTSRRVRKFMSITREIIKTNSKALKIDPENIEVINRGRDIDHLRREADQLLKTLEGFEEGPVLLTVARLLKRKGLADSITAMSEVVRIFPSVKYIIAGEGHDHDFFQNLIKELKLESNVFLLGNRRDVPGLLKRADIFIFPSHFEGQGGALVEAMIMGKPIIASRIPVIEESVIENQSALLFRLKDVDDLAGKIIWALQNPEKMEELGKNACEEAEKRFDIEDMVRKHENLYDAMIS